MDFTKLNGPETYKALAEALPYELQSILLTIRDDGLDYAEMPPKAYIALYELMLIETPEGEESRVTLSRLGSHLVNFCSC